MGNSRPPLSLLVVEDDKVASGIIVRMIAGKFPELKIHVAENGRTGLELFREHLPDIVITDINMPEMDGIQMAGEVKSIKADTPFIVLTAYSDKNYFERFREIGFTDYMMKPVDFRRLFASIERCIDDMRQGAE